MRLARRGERELFAAQLRVVAPPALFPAKSQGRRAQRKQNLHRLVRVEGQIVRAQPSGERALPLIEHVLGRTFHAAGRLALRIVYLVAVYLVAFMG